MVLLRHSVLASCVCRSNVSGHLESRHKLLAGLPKRTTSSSDILLKRARNFLSSALDSIAIDMRVLVPAEVGRLSYND